MFLWFLVSVYRAPIGERIYLVAMGSNEDSIMQPSYGFVFHVIFHLLFHLLLNYQSVFGSLNLQTPNVNHVRSCATSRTQFP